MSFTIIRYQQYFRHK